MPSAIRTSPDIPEAASPSSSLVSRRYRAIRTETERRAMVLSPEDQQIQSMPDCSPTKWHRAHTSWFFETFFLSDRDGYRAFDPAYAYLFNSYYEAVGTRQPRPERGLLSRPDAEEIARYRAHVDAAMIAAIERGLGPERLALLELGLQHEQQHQELILTDIKHAFWINPLHPAYAPGAEMPMPAQPGAGWVDIPSGIYEVGAEDATFAFDNEGPRHRVYLHGARLAARPVTCGEYLDFMQDGGYERPEFWLSDGWAAVRSGWRSPLYWIADGEDWRIFTLEGEKNVAAAEPVQNVSFYEAAAYAAWAGKRLPTEFEWEVAATLGNMSPGQVWEWTSSAYGPYPGYRPPAGAIGEYNGKFMSGQMVLRGGSWATPAGHARHSYRNFFPPSARWQASGLRLVEDL